MAYLLDFDEEVVVFVISVGKRELSEVYSEAVTRILRNKAGHLCFAVRGPFLLCVGSSGKSLTE